jgi:hypothetical protein
MGINEPALRELANSWSGKGPEDRAKKLNEVMATLPPAYHTAVKKYFAEK